MRRAAFALLVTCAAFAADFAPLRPRAPWRPDPGLPAQDVAWERILENTDVDFLTDNQLSVSLDAQPGLARVHYFPVRSRPVLKEKLDWEAVMRGNQFRERAGRVRVVAPAGVTGCPALVSKRWWPHRVERVWSCGASQVREEIAVSGNAAVVRFKPEAGPPLAVEFVNGFDGKFSTVGVSGAAVLLFENGVAFASTPAAQYRVERPVSFVIALGYDPAGVASELTRRRANPGAVFAEARTMWNYYFRALVPRLESSDTNLVRLYYYLFYVVRSSLYDIPYEPYWHPYTSPWKTGAIWQWAWNTGFNAIAERWLNDPSLCQQGMRLIARHGAAMNVGSYLRPLPPVRQPYTMWDWSELVDTAQKKLTIRDYDILFEQPYTVPNAFLGVWEVYRSTGDKEFLRLNLPILEQYESVARSKARPGSLITPLRFMFDEFDYSLRWKPVQKTFTKGGLQRGYDVAVDMVDMNAYLVELRRILAQAYRELGRPAEARAMDELAGRSAAELNRRLWDNDLKFYCDVRSDTGASTRVRAVSGFSPLHAGIVPSERKAALLAALDDPQGFAAPYAVPSVELRHPDLDPNLLTYGGDALAVSGIWTVTVALVRAGEPERAARSLRSAIAMITKDGVSSAYSYNPITAKPNQRKHELTTQCAIVNDLICRYIAGFEPRGDTRFEFNPIALDRNLSHFRFGPYRYKSRYAIETEWNGREYIVKVNGRSLRSPRPRRIVAALSEDGNLTEVQ